jgi:hypothetical protein
MIATNDIRVSVRAAPPAAQALSHCGMASMLDTPPRFA